MTFLEMVTFRVRCESVRNRFITRCVGDADAGKASQKNCVGQREAPHGSVGESAKMTSPYVLLAGSKPSAHVVALKGAWSDDATSLRKTFVEPVLLPLLDADECSAASPVFDKAFPKTGAFRINGCCKWSRGEARYLSQEPDAAFSDAEAVRLFREDRLTFELLSCPTYIAPDERPPTPLSQHVKPSGHWSDTIPKSTRFCSREMGLQVR